MSDPAAPLDAAAATSDKVMIRARATGKALPPQPIRMKVPGWGGAKELRMENGSEPQPWHCPPFVDAATYGLELIYPYHTECHVINDKGEVRIEFNFPQEPGGGLTGREFGVFPPKPTKFYLFQTALDIEAPPGHAIRTEPHPRFYTDATGTVPAAIIGHVQTEWWSKTIFCVFKAPLPGQRHIFRKGEPYAQILAVPHAATYEVVAMEDHHAARRARIDRDLGFVSPYIAKNVWFNKDGDEFRDHYRVMERAFNRDGPGGIDAVMSDGLARFQGTIPSQPAPVEECLAAAYQLQQQGRYVEARTIYQAVLSWDPNNDQAISMWGILAAETKAMQMALHMMHHAAKLKPDSAVYRANLGRLLLRMNRPGEAEPMLRKALELQPNDPKTMSDLGIVVAQTGRVDEGMQLAQAAAAAAPDMAMTHFHVGVIYANTGRPEEAKPHLQRALQLKPDFTEAKEVLGRLPGALPAPSWE